MAITKEHRCQVDVVWRSGREARVSAAPRGEILGGPTPLFSGAETDWSPEHLLLGAVALCYLQTYLDIAEAARLGIRGFGIQGVGALSKSGPGRVFSEISLTVTLDIDADDTPAAERLLDLAKQHCVVANSLRPEMTFKVALRVTPSKTAEPSPLGPWQ